MTRLGKQIAFIALMNLAVTAMFLVTGYVPTIVLSLFLGLVIGVLAGLLPTKET